MTATDATGTGLTARTENSFIPLACAECDDSLFSGPSSIRVCYITFPSTRFHQLVFHPPSLHLAIYFLVFLSALFPNSYIILFLGILFSSILSTCPNQCNLFHLIVSLIVGFLTMHRFLYWSVFSSFLLHCHILGLTFYTLTLQKCLFAFHLSLLVSRFLMHMLKFCLLLRSLVFILVF